MKIPLIIAAIALAGFGLIGAASLLGIDLPGGSTGQSPSPDRGQSAASSALAVTDLTIDSDTGQGPLHLAVGDEAQLVPLARLEDDQVRRDAPVSWASSDEAIASVDGTGNLRALSIGTAIVSARLEPWVAEIEVSID